jgi:hypothetical protein
MFGSELITKSSSPLRAFGLDVRDEARIIFDDIADVTDQEGSLTFTSDFPLQIELRLDPEARLRIENVNSV